MHELSIALSIVELAGQEAEKHPGRVSAVHLKLGALSGVVKQALLSSYEMACEDTLLAGSRLVVQEVPTIVFCRQCNQHRELSSIQWFCCPDCGTPCREVLQGKELEVVALEMQE